MLSKILLLILSILIVSCENANKEVDEFLNQNSLPKTDFLECEEIRLEAESVSDNQAVLKIISQYDNHLVYKKDLDVYKPLKMADGENINVSNLDFLTEYQFKVIATDENYNHCSSDTLVFETTEKINYSSCQEILDYNDNSESGVYELLLSDNSFIDVYCKMIGSDGWTQILYHDVPNGGVFTNMNEALDLNINDPESNIYSILSKVELFKKNEKFTFWLNYPDVTDDISGNFWSQTSNPIAESILGYSPISIYHTSSYWGGLEVGSSNTLLDGSTGHSNWWYAVGSVNFYGGNKVPGPGVSVERVILYVK